VILPRSESQERHGVQAAPPVERGLLDRGRALYAGHVLLKKAKNAGGWTFDILATDLNDNLSRPPRLDLRRIRSAQHKRGAAQKYFKPTMRSAAGRRATEVAHPVERVNLNDDSKMTFLKGMTLFLLQRAHLLRSGIEAQGHAALYSNLLPGGYMSWPRESLYQVDDDFTWCTSRGHRVLETAVGYTGGGNHEGAATRGNPARIRPGSDAGGSAIVLPLTAMLHHRTGRCRESNRSRVVDGTMQPTVCGCNRPVRRRNTETCAARSSPWAQRIEAILLGFAEPDCAADSGLWTR